MQPDQLPTALRRAILERDGCRCARRHCARIAPLAVHHVIARDDGGDDDPANLITLCAGCHREWHALEVRSEYPFARWLDAYPLPALLAAFDELVASWADWAELERPEQLRRTQRAMARTGRTGGTPRYGATPAEARAVARVRALHADGMSLRAIAAQLELEGHRPRSSSTWHAKVVRSMLAAAS